MRHMATCPREHEHRLTVPQPCATDGYHLRFFRSYRSLTWARYFLEYWIWRTLRSRIELMMRVAQMLRTHQELLMNWFRVRGEISSAHAHSCRLPTALDIGHRLNRT